MQFSTLRPVSGIAGVVGGFLLTVVNYAFAYVHGSTTGNRELELFSLTGDDYGRLAGIAWLLVLVLILGIYVRFRSQVDDLGRAGFNTVLVSLGLIVVANVLTSWIVNVDDYWEQYGGMPWYVAIGYVVGVLAQLPLAVGLIMLGVALRRVRFLPAWWHLTLLVMGGWIPLAIFLGFQIPEMSAGTVPWDIAFGSIWLPVSAGLMMLGVLLWFDKRKGI